MTREYVALASSIAAAVLAGVWFIFTGSQLRRNAKALKAAVSWANGAIGNRPRTPRAEAPPSQ